MKNIYLSIVFISFIIIFIYGEDVTPNNEVERKLLDFFTKWRQGDTASLPFSLPSLETLYIPPLNGSYSGKGVKLTYNTSRIRVDGMNNFSVTELDVSLSEMRASGSLDIPMLFVSAENYKVEGRAFYVYSLRGSGKLSASFENIQLLFGIRITRDGIHTKVNELNVNFAIGGIQVNLENSSWPMNKVLNKEGVKIIEGYHEDIVNATENNLARRLDSYLTTVTPVELFNLMQTSVILNLKNHQYNNNI